MKLFKQMTGQKLAAPDEVVVQPNAQYQADEAQKCRELQGCTLADFEQRVTLGTGSFGRVRLVKHRKTGRLYALKMLSKALVLRTKQLEHILCEKRVLQELSHPFIVSMYTTFQDESYLYMVLEYSIGGEFFTHLRKACRFPNDTARFYAAGVVLTFEYLHNRGIIYRDLKPENLLLDSQGHLKICDFGFSKNLAPGSNTWTLCGTPEYLAPEIILNKGHGKAVDWWALGVLIFEMLAGYPPFYCDDRMQLYQTILSGKIEFPKHLKREARDLISGLLTADLSRRLGNLKGGAKDIRAHPWFKGFDWEALVNRTLPAPIAINAKSPDDSSFFDEYDENDGPDIGVGNVRPEQQVLFKDFG
jgi:protein kinase X